MNNLNNMIYDGIYGFAIGDALGVPIKNINRSGLRLCPIADMHGYGYYGVPTGTWSENTSLMLSIVDSIGETDDINYDDIMLKMLNWNKYNNFKSRIEIFKLSDANKIALSNFKNGVLPVSCGSNISSDCSCLSRMVPLIYYLHSRDYIFDEEVSIVNDVCSMSHLNEVNMLGCMIFCDYTSQLLNGIDKFEALKIIRSREYNKYYSDNCISLYNRILNDDFISLYSSKIKSGDDIIETLEAGLWSFLNGKNFDDCLINAINLGNNTNTIGAITGLWSGIAFGNQQIPERWYNKLKGKEILNDLCIKFSSVLEEKKIRNKKI